MRAVFIIWAFSVCLQIVLADTEEQCDIYGALVRKPGRQCICDQQGVVRCKPRIGGRFLVCVLDLSKMGAEVKKVYDKIMEQKRIYRDWVIGAAEKKEEEKKEKIDQNFDPPEFTMTFRPSIDGGIGDDDVGFGIDGEDFVEGDGEEGEGREDAGGEDDGKEDAGGEDDGKKDAGGKDDGGASAERFRKMRQLMKKQPVSRVTPKFRPNHTADPKPNPRAVFHSRKPVGQINSKMPHTNENPPQYHPFKAKNQAANTNKGQTNHEKLPPKRTATRKTWKPSLKYVKTNAEKSKTRQNRHVKP